MPDLANESQKEAAARLTAFARRDGFIPHAMYAYRDKDGNTVFLRLRLEKPDGGKKIFPMSRNGKGWQLKEPDFPSGKKPLYNLPELLENPNATVFIPEGENKVDVLAKLGIIATTSGGTTSAGKADWTLLKARNVVIWPDNDEPGAKYADEVTEILLGLDCRVERIDVSKLNLPEKGDAIDYLKANHEASKEDIEDLSRIKSNALDDKVKLSQPQLEQAQKEKTQSALLVELAEAAELFHNPDGKAFASISANGHTETWPLTSRGFKDWLTRLFYLASGKTPNAQAMQDALGVLSGRARFEGEEYETHVRTSEFDGAIYIDLADDKWRAVEVTEDGWKIVTNPPVKFIRKNGMRPLPIPNKAGSLDGLWRFINIEDKDSRKLVIGWILGAMRSKGPYPVLAMQGEQGSGKSVAGRVLRGLIDPSKTPVRTVPRNEHDLMIAASNSLVVALDNLSGVSNWLSDAICRLATGGGFATRELYTDSEEYLIDVQCPVILNGIDDIAIRQDLVDRSIVITLPTIPDNKRKPESDFWREYESALPGILGALLDAVSGALKNLPHTKIDSLPRMADFATWVTAAEISLGWESGSFMAAYSSNRQRAVETGLDASQVWLSVQTFMEGKDCWEGTATELHEDLPASDQVKRSKAWPKTPRALSTKLRRLVTAMREVGYDVRFTHGTRNLISIERVRNFATSPTLPTSGNMDEVAKVTNVDEILTQSNEAETTGRELFHT